MGSGLVLFFIDGFLGQPQFPHYKITALNWIISSSLPAITISILKSFLLCKGVFVRGAVISDLNWLTQLDTFLSPERGRLGRPGFSTSDLTP